MKSKIVVGIISEDKCIANALDILDNTNSRVSQNAIREIKAFLTD